MKSLAITIAFLFFSAFAIGQDSVQFQNDTIPFRLSSANNIIIKTIFNEKDTLELMFHTANSGLSIIEESSKKLTSIRLDDSTNVNSWGGASSARYSKNNQIQIGKRIFTNITVTESKRSGPETDGKFGVNFFDKTVIELDFDQKHLIVYNELPVKVKNYSKANMTGDDGWLFLEAISIIQQKSLSHSFLIHTGYGGTILYDDAFVKANKLGESLEVISESELQDSYGNVLKTKKAILPQLNIGAFEFEEVPVGFFEGKIARQNLSVIGGGFLKKFNWILDFQENDLYLVENGMTDIAFPSK